MKKGKIIGKKQIVIGVMVLSLAVAVALNMKYAGNSFNTSSNKSASENLGDSIYVNAKVGKDGFSDLRTQRSETRKEALELLDETINNVKSDATAKKAAEEAKTAMALRMEKENTIESLIKAKGFSDVLVVLSDKEINVAVKSDKLLDSETLQIQDIAVSQSGLPLENIKIVTVK